MSEAVYVWDKFVRLFHWSLVALFVTSYLTGESESELHIYSGYAIVCLIVARIAWGFIGPKHARFRDFVFGPVTVAEYAKSLLDGKPTHYLGHNPLGGLMVVALLLTLSLVTVSGMKLLAVEEGRGPLAGNDGLVVMSQAVASPHEEYEYEYGEHEGGHEEEGEEFWEEIHEAAVNFMWLLVVLHIAGVLFSSMREGESLVKAMITGYKRRG